MLRWRHISSLLSAMGIACVLHLPAQASAGNSDPALAAIQAQVESGELDPDEALLLAVTRVLSPEELPADLQALSASPLRCGTEVMMEVGRRWATMSDESRAEIGRRLAPASLAKGGALLSSAGHFVLSYETSGTNAVPAEDLDPANGIPDYVERVSEYFETSWAEEVDSLGFVAPDLQGQPYEVSFEAMASYGYTTLSATSPGGTRIVMHNDFQGFPPNQDPEGNVLGAAKVTAAHEFKHAIQYATSQWQETGLWPELDAVWAEDIVFDQVNDYYNYLPNGSPIVDPGSSLDAHGGGSYEDCIFQHWISQTWGDSTIVQMWDHRSQVPSEPMLDSYEWMFAQRGTSFAESWRDFAAWNYACGARALSGFGYEEAAGYPTSVLGVSYPTLPATRAAVVEHLGADFSEFSGFSAETGSVTIRVQRQNPSSLVLEAMVYTRSGTWQRHPLALTLPDQTVTLPEQLFEVSSVVLVASNADPYGSSQSFTAKVSQIIVPPTPIAQLGTSSISFTAAAGDSAGRVTTLRNTGEPESVLHYRALEMAAIPPSTEILADIGSSMVAVAASEYSPGTSMDLFFSVTNNTSDLEWLAGVDITFPPGASVDSMTNFVGGSAGDLVANGAVGDSVTVSWIDANGSWGNVKNGETATAHVYVTLDPLLYGDLNLDWTIYGDGYGSGTHVVSGTLSLTGPPNPSFRLVAPTAVERHALGSPIDILWDAAAASKVRLELSRDGGASWEVLADSTDNDGMYQWTCAGSATASARIRVSTLDGSISDSSPQDFWIYEPLPWFTVSPAEDSLAAGEEIELSMGFDTRSLSPGIHTGVLFIEHDGPAGSSVADITLDVRDSATPATPHQPSLELLGNQPNPFNPATKIHFRTGTGQRVAIDIFDASGRRVCRLLDDYLAAGDHYVDWSSADDRGHRVSSGTYYYRVAGSSKVLTGKLTLVK